MIFPLAVNTGLPIHRGFNEFTLTSLIDYLHVEYLFGQGPPIQAFFNISQRKEYIFMNFMKLVL